MKVEISLDRRARHVGRGNLFTRCVVCWVDAGSISYNLIVAALNIHTIVITISDKSETISYRLIPYKISLLTINN